MPLSNIGSACRQSGVGKFIELYRARSVRHCRLDHNLVWPADPELLGIIRARLDVDPAPPSLIESKAHRIDDGILSSYVEVPSALKVSKGTPKEHILEILRVRHERHEACRNPLVKSPRSC